MTDLPEPLTPHDADLTDFPFTPIFRARLFGSRFHARVTDGEWRAGVTLWLKSWDQVPAGSLPDDDIDLCRLAELGRDLKQWKRVKSGALHGWIKCADGLLYHPTVAEGVNEAWERKRKQSSRGAKGAAARWRKHSDDMPEASETDATSIEPECNGDARGNAETMAEAMLGDGNRQGQGQGQIESSELRSVAAGQVQPTDLPPDAKTALFRDGLAMLRELTGKPEAGSRALLGRLLKSAGDDCASLLAALREAAQIRPAEPVSWLTAAAQRIGGNPALPVQRPAQRPDLPAIPSPFDPPDFAGYRSWLLAQPGLEARPQEGGKLAFVLHKWLPDSVAEQINEAAFAGGAQFADRVDWSPLADWCRDDIPGRDNFAATIRRVAASVDGPIRSLRLFDAALRETRRVA